MREYKNKLQKPNYLVVFLPILFLAIIGLAGCASKSNNKDEDEHDETLQLTSYNEDFEVFAEAVPFVVNQQSEIKAHISSLKNFQPLAKGKVTLSLIVGTEGIRQTLEKPSKAGIYQFSLKPTAAGNGKLVFDIQTGEGISQVVIPNIRVYTDVHEAQHTAADVAITSSNAVAFTKEQSWKIDFATEEVKAEPFGEIIKTTAQILPSKGDERLITAKTNGIVLLSGNNIIEGKAVTAGQALFSIESGGLADNNLSIRYSEAENEYRRAKTEYERKQELAKEKIVSESELLQAQTEYTNAKNIYTNLQKNFSSGKQNISSPIGGFITQILVRNGEYVEAGQPVLIVSQNRDLLIRAELQPKYHAILNRITAANIRIPDKDKTYSLEELGGKILSFGKSVDVGNPLIPVTFQVKNTIDFLPGSFVEMFIKTQTNHQALTVPNEAIIEEMGNYFIYVQLTPELFEKRLIKKGVSDGFRTEIQEGIAEGERVVSKGAILVKLAQASEALDAHSGHVH